MEDFRELIEDGDLDAIRREINPANYETLYSSEDDLTPLTYAIELGEIEMSQYFINTCKADLTRKNLYGQTPLHLATYHGHLPIIQALIEAGAATEAKDSKGKTPLMLAIKHGDEISDIRIIQTFIDANADIEAQDKDGYTPLMTAAETGQTEVIEILVMKLVTNNPNLNAIQNGISKALIIATQVEDIRSVRTLLELIKDREDNKDIIETKDSKYSYTALHLAQKGGDNEIIQALIEAGADTEAKDMDGYMPQKQIEPVAASGKQEKLDFGSLYSEIDEDYEEKDDKIKSRKRGLETYSSTSTEPNLKKTTSHVEKLNGGKRKTAAELLASGQDMDEEPELKKGGRGINK